jgi:hypothetical protein
MFGFLYSTTDWFPTSRRGKYWFLLFFVKTYLLIALRISASFCLAGVGVWCITEALWNNYWNKTHWEIGFKKIQTDSYYFTLPTDTGNAKEYPKHFFDKLYSCLMLTLYHKIKFATDRPIQEYTHKSNHSKLGGEDIFKNGVPIYIWHTIKGFIGRRLNLHSRVHMQQRCSTLHAI